MNDSKYARFCIIVLSIAIISLSIGSIMTNRAIEKLNKRINNLESYIEYLYEEEENE